MYMYIFLVLSSRRFWGRVYWIWLVNCREVRPHSVNELHQQCHIHTKISLSFFVAFTSALFLTHCSRSVSASEQTWMRAQQCNVTACDNDMTILHRCDNDMTIRTALLWRLLDNTALLWRWHDNTASLWRWHDNTASLWWWHDNAASLWQSLEPSNCNHLHASLSVPSHSFLYSLHECAMHAVIVSVPSRPFLGTGRDL